LAARLEEAAACYDDVRAEWPDNADVWHLSAALALSQKELETAKAHIQKALFLDPSFPEAHNTAGNIFKELDAWDVSLEHYLEATRINPSMAEAYANQADILRVLGRLDDAVDAARRAITLNPGLPEAHGNLGAALIDLEELEEAQSVIKRAVELAPGSPAPLINLSKVQILLGDIEPALASAEEAAALAPELPETGNALGNAHYAQRAYDKAEEAYRRALKIRPSDAEIMGNLGNALARQHRLSEAEKVLMDSLAIEPDNPSSLTNLGGVLLEGGRVDRSLDLFDRALSLEPEHTDAHWNRGLARLLMGSLPDGFADYEYRWRLPEFSARHQDLAVWAGEDLRGRSILVHSEQGFGDTLQLIRFATHLVKRGAEVYLETHQSLVRLLEGVESLSGVVARGETTPQADFQIPIMSLPHLLGITLETIPADIPYIPLCPATSVNLGKHGNLNVGFVWGGRSTHKNDANRSIPLETFTPLFDLPGLTWVSLQVDDRHEDAETLKLPLRDLRPQITDFADTATAIAGLDLVIAVDTAVAHLAGALGKEVWIMLPFAPDWRWLLEREDSPWYPSARLFRQPAPGDWASVVGQVLLSLDKRSETLI